MSDIDQLLTVTISHREQITSSSEESDFSDDMQDVETENEIETEDSSFEENEVTDVNHLWKSSPPKNSNNDVQPLVCVPAVKGQAKISISPMKSWSLLVNDSMLESVVRYTNTEMCQRFQNMVNFEAHHEGIDLVELKAFIGLLYLAGLRNQNHGALFDLWSFEFGYFRCTMSLKRFTFILSCLRFDDKDTRDDRKAAGHNLAPVDEIWYPFVENCQRFYSSSTNVTLDRHLIPFSGQFPGKVRTADGCGIAVVSANDAQTSYMFNAEVHVGNSQESMGDPMPIYYSKILTEPIHGTQRVVVCDSWFTSVSMIECLRELKLFVVGTLKKGASKKGPKVEFKYLDSMSMACHRSKSNKVNVYLSSLHKTGQINEIEGKPEIAVYHEKFKTGVSEFARIVRANSVARDTVRWPLRIFYAILDMARVNANILYNLRLTNDKAKTESMGLDHKSFMKSLALDLIRPHLRRRYNTAGLQKSLLVIMEEILGVEVQSPAADELVVASELQNKKLEKRRRCRICHYSANKKTKTCCAKCETAICADHTLNICTNCSKTIKI